MIMKMKRSNKENRKRKENDNQNDINEIKGKFIGESGVNMKSSTLTKWDLSSDEKEQRNRGNDKKL